MVVGIMADQFHGSAASLITRYLPYLFGEFRARAKRLAGSLYLQCPPG